MDIGRYRVLSPNAIPDTVPCFSYTPRSLRKGQTLDFDVCLKWFPKPQFRYRDVLRWYLRSMQNSDPLTQGWIKRWDGNFQARPLPKGSLASAAFSSYDLSPPSAPPKEKQAWLKRMSRVNVGSLWLQGWDPWDVTYPTEGSWKTGWGVGMETSAREIHDEISWLRQNGLHPFLYCNQLLNEQGALDHRPPLRSWLGRNERGQRESWPGAIIPVPTSVTTISGAGIWKGLRRAWTFTNRAASPGIWVGQSLIARRALRRTRILPIPRGSFGCRQKSGNGCKRNTRTSA